MAIYQSGSWRRARRARRGGAALIEFALIAVLFFTMLLGMIQFGIYQSTTNTLWNLSREGARFATVSKPSDDAIRDYVRRVAPPNVDARETANKLSIDISPPTTRVSGESVTVTLRYNMADKIIFPTVGRLLNKNYVSSSTMRVE